MAVTAENLLAEKVAELTDELKTARSTIAKLRTEVSDAQYETYKMREQLTERREANKCEEILRKALDEIDNLRGYGPRDY